jgi:hypothetical protein
MGSDLRAGTGAGRLQRILTMRLRRVATVGGLALGALLAWLAAVPPAQRAHDAGAPIAVARGATSELSAGTEERPPASPTASQSARVVVRHQLLARARGTDGQGEWTLTGLLAASRAPSFGDVSASAQTELRRLPRRHAPYSEASPFDATAPPTASRRNG